MNNTFSKINMENYSRKDLYEFYKTFDRPCFNIAAKKNSKKIYKYAKRNHMSFFLVSLYAILKAANSVPEMKMRVVDGEVVRFDNIDVCTPISIDGENFCEVILPYYDSLDEFVKNSSKIINEVKTSGKISCQENTEDRILISCLPWLHFESYTCPELDTHQVMPIVTYGKMEKNLIPINLKASHYFMDGVHVAKFFDLVEENFNNPKSL